MKKTIYNFSIKSFLMLILLSCTLKAQNTSIKFTVDMTYQINDGTFNSSTDKVYLRGAFNNWDLSTPMDAAGSGVYVKTLLLEKNNYYSFKFFTDAPGFPNGGYEANIGIDNENRWMIIGENNLELAKIYFNNANLPVRKETAHFQILCDVSDIPNLDRTAAYLEEHFARITGALASTITSKVRIWVFPDQKTYFIYKGYPESPSWSVGGAVGKLDVLLYSPNYMDWNGFLSTALHEFTHIAVGWKMAIRVPSWLNEGAATLYSDDPPARPLDSIRDIVNNILGGTKPALAYIEQESFGDGNGYPLSYSIADFILTIHGAHKLAEFIVNVDYSVLGYSSKDAFQNAWHNFLDSYYLAPQVNLKFSVDMSYYISKGWFNPTTDKVYIGGNFNNWYTFGTINEGNGIYSFSTFSPCNIEYQYKFKINTPGAVNQGWEENNRILQTVNENIIVPLKPFNNIDNSLTLFSPNGGEFLIAGDLINISWKYTSIQTIKIEYSINNGVTWSEIVPSVSTDLYSFAWLVPNIMCSDTKIRITDIANSSNSDISDNSFSIVRSNAGGPYSNDRNTVLLMHFDNNFENNSSPNNQGTAYNSTSFITSALIDLNKALKIDNTVGGSCVKVQNYSGINLSGNWTIECWFYINNIGSGSYAYPYLLMKGAFPSDYSISFSQDGRSVTAGYTNTTGGAKNVTCGSISQKTWYYLAFTRNASNNTLSLVIRDKNRNIVSSSSINDNTIPKNSSSELSIGGVTGGSNIQFDGYIDELRVSNVVRDFVVGIDDEKRSIIPSTYNLSQNYPNPFNPVTTIKYFIPMAETQNFASQRVTMKVYDFLGREIATLVNGIKSPGIHSVQFDAHDLPSGIYFYKLHAGKYILTKKMVLIK